MSRSRKKTPIWKQRNDKDFKRYSNKMIRHTDIASGAAFKRVMNPYDICDWRFPPVDDDDKKKAARK